MSATLKKERNTQSFKDNLTKLMTAKGFTEATLSKESGVSQPVLNYLIRGNTKNPGIEIVQKIAHALGTDISYLTGERSLQSLFISNTIPILNWEAIGQWLSGKLSSVKLESVNVSSLYSEKSFALRASLITAPVFPEGSLILIDPVKTYKTGDFVLIQQKDNEYSLRKLLMESNRAFFRLIDGTLTEVGNKELISGVVLGTQFKFD